MKKKIYQVAQPYFSKKDISWIKKNVDQILTGKLSTGPLTLQFEKKFAKFIGTKYAIFLNSCSSALEIAVKSLNLRKDDEVIVPVQTFIATGMAVTLQGAKVVFAEIDEDTFSICLKDLKKKVSPKTKALMLVHFGGYISKELIEIRNYCKKKRIKIIEDCAHTFGSSISNIKTGSIGIAGCFSFFSTKTITTGEGGMLTTNDPQMFNLAKSLRERGRDWSKDVEIYNNAWRTCRVPEFSALLGLNQISQIKKINSHRNKVCKIYNKILDKSDYLKPLPFFKNIKLSIWKHITIIKNKKISRDILKKNLFEKYGIVINWAYTPALHLQPVYKKIFKKEKIRLKKSEDIMKRHFHLPLHMKISERDAKFIANCVVKEIDNLINFE